MFATAKTAVPSTDQAAALNSWGRSGARILAGPPPDGARKTLLL